MAVSCPGPTVEDVDQGCCHFLALMGTDDRTPMLQTLIQVLAVPLLLEMHARILLKTHDARETITPPGVSPEQLS
jgi:hypothetical protein